MYQDQTQWLHHSAAAPYLPYVDQCWGPNECQVMGDAQTPCIHPTYCHVIFASLDNQRKPSKAVQSQLMTIRKKLWNSVYSSRTRDSTQKKYTNLYISGTPVTMQELSCTCLTIHISNQFHHINNEITTKQTRTINYCVHLNISGEWFWRKKGGGVML
jgi:hypothetical protein